MLPLRRYAPRMISRARPFSSSASMLLVTNMSWFKTAWHNSEEKPEPIHSRIVVCAPPEDLPFWKARLESLGVNRVDLHHTHRDALNELHNFDWRNYDEDWTVAMLFDKKIGRAPDFSNRDEEMLRDDCYYCWTSVTEIGDWSPKNATYKSSDQELVDLLADAFNRTDCGCYENKHVYKPNRHVKKGNL